MATAKLGVGILGSMILGTDSLESGPQAYGQAQASILRPFAFGQAQADILHTYFGHAQAQARIKQTYNAFAQAQTFIIFKQSAFGQANADIFTPYRFAQAQALILRDSTQIYGQAQAQVLGPPFITIVNSYSGSVNGSDINWPNAATAGNILAVFIGSRDPVGGPPAGWDSRIQFSNLAVFTKKAAGGETSMGFTQRCGYVVIELKPVTEVSIRVGTNSGTGNHPTVNITPMEGFHSIIFDWTVNSISGDPGSNSWTPDAGWTTLQTAQISGGVSPYDWLGYRIVGYSSGTYTPGVTTSASTSWNAGAISFALQPWGFAQAQASIHRFAGFAWAQALIVRHEGYAQAQAFIGTRRTFGQAQAYISYIRVYQEPVEVLEYAQDPRTQVYQTPVEVLESPQDTRAVTYQVPVEILMKPIRFAFGQALAMMNFWMAPAQAQASILLVRQGFGQAQARIFYPPGFGQAAAQITSTFTRRYGQAQGFIRKSAGYGQAQAKLNATVTRYAQAQGYIIHTWQFGQAQGYINQFNICKAGQAQGYIRKSAGYSQARALIWAKRSQIAHVRAKIKGTARGYGQAQTYILFRGYFAQAQALIGHLQMGQAQARIVSFNTIQTGLARAYVPRSGGYLVRFNGYDLPGYAQSEDYISKMDINKKYIAYSDPFQEYLGLTNKSISIGMKIWDAEYIYQDVKNQIQRAGTILRTSRDYVDLYIQRTDRHYRALTKKITTEKSVGESMRMLDYEVEFEAKPWLIEDEINLLSGTSQIIASRTINDGGWTPTIITLTGTDITVSGYTQTEPFTGFISVSGSVTNLVIDTENYTATMNGVSQNFRIRNEDYRLYVGPLTTYFTISGASSCEIQYQNRFYL